MPLKRKFLVYFEQINQTCYEVEADSPSKAIRKAKREWRRDYAEPDHRSTAERK